MLFELQGINQHYGAFQALTDVTVAVRPGVVGLLGPNGSGKSTLIKTLLGMLEPTSGHGKVLGQDVRSQSLAIRERVGYMPEHDAYFADLTGFESVVYAARLSGLPRRHAFRRAHEVLDYVGMEEARYREVQGYSTGMRQRIKLAQALVHGPQLVFLDEPTNGLDPKGREEMLGLIGDLGRIPVNVLLSSHVLHDVEAVCDAVLLLQGGQVKHYGPLRDLLTTKGGEYELQVRTGGPQLSQALTTAGFQVATPNPLDLDRLVVVIPSEEAIDALWAAVIALDLQVRHFAPLTVSLERAFVDLVEPGAHA